MTAERWKRIEEVYHGALECPLQQRKAFIAEACQGDEDLREEVEDLVRREDSPAANLLERSPVTSPEEPIVPWASGTRLGPYEIIEPIAAGGMGLVFRAVDTRLGRSVAIKTSQTRLSARLTREARAVASLNHPNICTLHDVGPDYLVMELVDGPTLADRIRQGPIPMEEALGIARQIAAALEAAHEAGIVHRDLKPANVKLRPDGSVKVLDFGLAKSRVESAPSPESVEIKLAGLILGTVSYMSPEQALGQEVDKRADIWAFGVVLYEMLTGVRPFDGATVSDCMARIVQSEPDLTKVPPEVRRLLGRCLEKDAQKRLRALGDWDALLDSKDSQRRSGVRRPLGKIAGWGIPAVLVVALAAWALSSKSAPARVTRFQVTLPENVTFDRNVSVSPDGLKLVFNATGEKSGLWIHDLDTLAWRRLPGTEGALSPFWSPDSRSLGYSTAFEVRKVELAGGPPVTLCAFPNLHPGPAAWSQRGVIVFAPAPPEGNGPLRSVSANGGPDTVLTAVNPERGETYHAYPTLLPDGRHFLYYVGGSAEVSGIYAGSVDSPPTGQPRERILATRAAARYVDGKLLFLRDGVLVAQPFDAARLSLAGEPVPVAEQVQAVFSSPVFSASAGVLAFRSGTKTPGWQLTWRDRQGKEIGTVGQPNSDTNAVLSPDQSRAAILDLGYGEMANIWLLDFKRGARTRFTFQPPAVFPVWSRDGARIFFSSGPNLESIFEKASNGTGPEKEWLKEPGVYHYTTSISPDGRFLLYYTMPKKSGPGVPSQTWVLPLETGRRPVLLLGTEFNTNRAVFSPDGRWIAYRTNESGTPELYLRPVASSGPAGLALGDGKWRVSNEGMTHHPPAWRRDSKELFYQSPKNVLTAVDVDGSRGSLPIGNPKPLFATPCSCGFDVSADGQRFLVRGATGAGGDTPITVVLNWQADLKRR